MYSVHKPHSESSLNTKGPHSSKTPKLFHCLSIFSVMERTPTLLGYIMTWDQFFKHAVCIVMFDSVMIKVIVLEVVLVQILPTEVAPSEPPNSSRSGDHEPIVRVIDYSGLLPHTKFGRG